MKIEPMSGSSPLDRGTNASIETLESRLLAAHEQAPGNQRADPEFEHLYQLLLAMEGQGEKVIYEFLRALRGPDGTTVAYPTAQALMAITLQVLVRLKDEGLEKSLLYKEVSGANGLAFSMDLFTKSLIRDVFMPTEDEAWEKSEW
ncbi:hypothetical protein [Pseudomonas brassicacearum]|uniref:hypothetical protein n=1 Tax=Pseudomonas brassicacearum TaxID=930166 RepID=UPI001DB5AA8F|nr:hypothetical protein [Pseudomonas brassicacearum]CAH0213816.1 hypothetical protein SRABI06_02222 [Pseudomonas brassicacearum]